MRKVFCLWILVATLSCASGSAKPRGLHEELKASSSEPRASPSTAPENADIGCLGDSAAGTNVVYLHGLDRPSPGEQEIHNRLVLSHLAERLSLRVALPRAGHSCGDSVCWGWKLDDGELADTSTAIDRASARCFRPGARYGLIGFSNGGYALLKMLRSCSMPRAASWAVASGSGMLKGPIESAPPDLSSCGRTLLLVGTRDEHNFDPDHHYIDVLTAKRAQIEERRFDGVHELPEEPLAMAFRELTDSAVRAR